MKAFSLWFIVMSVSLLWTVGLFAEEDTRDIEGHFFKGSVGLFGHFDRIHVRDTLSAPDRVNTILTCFGWGVLLDHGYLSTAVGIRSQLGTSSLDPGFVDDEQLVVTFGIQGKYPFSIGKILEVFPTVEWEYGHRISGNIRNAHAYFPFLAKFGLGADLELTRETYLRLTGNFAVNPAEVPSLSAQKFTTFFSVSEAIGFRFE